MTNTGSRLAAAFGLVGSISPADPVEKELRRDQLQMAMRASHSASTPFMVAAPALALVALQWQPWWLMLAWLTVMLAIALKSRAVSRRVVDRPADKIDLAADGKAVVVTSTLTAVWMSVGATLIWTPGDPINHLFVLLILNLSVAIGTVYSAPYKPMMWPCHIYTATAMGLCFSDGSLAYTLIGALGIVVGAQLHSVGDTINKSAREILTLRNSERALAAELTAANRTKSEFLANMSHELRTPLNAVIGFSDVMRHEMLGPLGNKSYLGYVNDIHASGLHLLTLIDQVLDLSKIEAGRYDLRESDVDLSALIEEAMRMVANRAATGQVTLVNDVPAGIVVRGDETALRQVALNITMNAVKFTGPAGTVRAYGLRMVDGSVAVAVEDNGCGIAGSDLETVFENFGQARHDIAVRERGTGLGLPIVRSLMRAHGGDATLQSEPGVGTTVFLSMPRTRLISWGPKVQPVAA